MAKWMKVDQQKINAPVHDSKVGLDLKLFVSPYDIPVALKGEFDNSIERFVIQLQYDSPDEKLVAEPDVADHIQFFSGCDSGRLHKIVLDVHEMNASNVKLEVVAQRVEHAIDQLRRTPPTPARRRNYVAAQRAISQLPRLVTN